MSARGIFVTGTDTGVGKTVVTAALVSLARATGIDAVPMKPVQTGAVRLEGGRWRSPDLDVCLAAAELGDGEYELMAPACFELPASPHLAARVEGRTISLDPIVDAFRRLGERHELVVAEGAGGVLVPLNDEATMVDLMAAFGVPAVLVARTALGTINHTLLSLGELGRNAIPVLGIVFCEADPAADRSIASDAIATIERRGGVPILGVIPHLAGGEAPARARRHLDGSAILDRLRSL